MHHLVDQAAQHAGLARVNLNVVEKIVASQSTRPAEVVLADVACHVWAAAVLDHVRLAARTVT